MLFDAARAREGEACKLQVTEESTHRAWLVPSTGTLEKQTVALCLCNCTHQTALHYITVRSVLLLVLHAIASRCPWDLLTRLLLAERYNAMWTATGPGEAGCFRQVAAVYSDHYRQALLCVLHSVSRSAHMKRTLTFHFPGGVSTSSPIVSAATLMHTAAPDM